MSYLFYVDENSNAILHPEIVKLCPPLAALNEQETLFVILFCDYCSPYKQHPEHERKRRAMLHAFGDNSIHIIESERVQIAINFYISLQYSPKVEAARHFQKKIDSLLLVMQEDTSPTGIKKTIEAIDLLKKQITVYEQEYDSEVQKRGVLKGKMTQSLLEEIKSNQKLWKSITDKR